MENKAILFEISDDIALITLKRPESMNAVNLEMIREIETAIAYVTSKNMARAMVLTGGEKVFAAGFDIKEMARQLASKPAHSLNMLKQTVHTGMNTNLASALEN